MRVVVLGGGYAGLTAARRLEGELPESAELVVVDESGTHLVQHELHRVIRRPGLTEDIRFPLADVLERADVVESRVAAVDPDAGEVDLGDRALAYDAGVVCLGAETNFGDLPGVAAHGLPLKRIEHARAIREAIVPVLERDGRLVVGGAGLAGIQVAGELAALNRERSCDATVLLLEQRESVAPTFEASFQRAVREALDTRGVDVRAGRAVTGADTKTVSLETGDEVSHDALIWTGGIRGSGAVGGDRPRVRSDLRLAGETFVAGDAARVVDDRGSPVPASARTAIGQGRVAARNVARVLETGGAGAFAPRLARYVDDDPGWIVSVGDGAVAQVGTTVLAGAAAQALKTSVGAGYLSRVGAIGRAVDVVRAELGQTRDRVTDAEG
jgi:NADH dehydrogenase